MARLSENTVFNFRDNVYLIGSNVSGDFAVGAIGSDDDFFLIAARPVGESNYPIITGNFLDSEGHVLFRIVQNNLIVNPGHCSKILSNRIGYEIHDVDDNMILKVETKFTNLPGQTGEIWVTTIEGNFYDKNRNLVVEANAEEGFIETSVGLAMGFNGSGFAMQLGMSEGQAQLAGIALSTFGKIFEPISGEHRGETIHLSGKVLMPGADIQDCQVIVENGQFAALGTGTLSNNQMILTGEALNIANLLGFQLSPPPENEQSRFENESNDN